MTRHATVSAVKFKAREAAAAEEDSVMEPLDVPAIEGPDARAPTGRLLSAIGLDSCMLPHPTKDYSAIMCAKNLQQSRGGRGWLVAYEYGSGPSRCCVSDLLCAHEGTATRRGCRRKLLEGDPPARVGIEVREPVRGPEQLLFMPTTAVPAGLGAGPCGAAASAVAARRRCEEEDFLLCGAIVDADAPGSDTRKPPHTVRSPLAWIYERCGALPLPISCSTDARLQRQLSLLRVPEELHDAPGPRACAAPLPLRDIIAALRGTDLGAGVESNSKKQLLLSVKCLAERAADYHELLLVPVLESATPADSCTSLSSITTGGCGSRSRSGALHTLMQAAMSAPLPLPAALSLPMCRSSLTDTVETLKLMELEAVPSVMAFIDVREVRRRSSRNCVLSAPRECSHAAAARASLRQPCPAHRH